MLAFSAANARWAVTGGVARAEIGSLSNWSRPR
jgi:hypothetical protein